MIRPLLAILICLVLSYSLSELFKKIGLPRVVGQIIAGLILGIGVVKSYLFTLDSINILDFLANLGIILLFYYVGIETNFKAFTKNVKKSVLISIFNTTLPLIAGFLTAKYLLHFDLIPSLIIGVSLSVSAQSVSIDILEELKLLKSRLGNLIVTAGAVDDILEFLLITVLLTAFHATFANLTIFRLVIDVIIFMSVLLIARLIFVPYTLKFFDIEKSSTSRFMLSMMIVMIIALLSDYLGIGLFIGAIAAGIIVRQTILKEITIPNWEQHDISKSTHIIAFGFLIPLFFIKIGLNTDISMILPNLGLILVFITIAIAGTVGGTIIAIILNKGSFKEGLLLGWGLNPKGDIELAIIALALQYAAITQQIFTALVIMSLLTTIISPIVFKMLILRFRKEKELFKTT